MEAAIVGAVLQSIIPSLLKLFYDNRSLISDNEKKIEKKIDDLCDDLKLLNTFMVSYVSKHYKDETLMGLAEEIRTQAYRVEDVLESYIVEKLLFRKKNAAKRFAGMFKHSLNLKSIGESIEDLRIKVQKTLKNNRAFAPRPGGTDKRTNMICSDNQLASYQVADKIIGFEDAADDILKRLGVKSIQQNGSEQLKVVAIHGMLGLGKTTLANKVLKDEATEYEFFTRIFINVTKNFDKKELLLNILRSLDNDILDQNMPLKELVKKVREGLKFKYLVVVDDVWEGEHWDEMKDAFPDKNNGSRVLITTRDEGVAEYVSPNDEPYQLRFMRPDEAKELLRMKVFDENKCPEELQCTEESILKKCNGLPLAIVVTGGILRKKPKDASWWQDVLDEVPRIAKEKVERIDRYIRLSYDSLDPEVKPCFLYLGVFPDNWDIKVCKVLQLWIAEGFIPEHETTTLERTAYDYLRELVNMNLLIVTQRSLSGKVKTCRLHDTLHDFCKKMARAEDLFQAIQQHTTPSSSRRLCCINSLFSKYISGEHPADKVRSFLSFGQDETFNEDPGSSMFKRFKLLRVLDIFSICIKFPNRFPTSLFDLVLLKFIAINFNLKILPKSMSSLHNLETLIVQTTEAKLDIQVDIWAMTKLRYLHTSTTTSLPACKDQSSSSENLQTMSTIAPQSLTKEVLGRTRELKMLGIRGSLGNIVKENGDSDLFEYLSRVNSLENLKLHGDDSKLLALPQPDKFPANLTKLSLIKTGLKWNVHMPTLGKLRFLKVLKLMDKAFDGADWKMEKGGFRSLTVLFIRETNLENWEAEADDLPKLRFLILKQINSLKQMPSDFKNMENLEKIDLEHTNKLLVKSAKDIQESRPHKIKLSVYPPDPPEK